MRVLFCMFVLAVLSAPAMSQVKVENHTTAGNLAPTQDPGCISMEEIGPSLSPADLQLGVNRCIRRKAWARAAEMYALMTMRGVYDTKRVRDRTAHQAWLVLQQNIDSNLTRRQSKRLYAELDHYRPGGDRFGRLCDVMRNSGPPEHSPSWMVEHGMDAFKSKRPKPLLDKFRPRRAWNEVIDDFAKCHE